MAAINTDGPAAPAPATRAELPTLSDDDFAVKSQPWRDLVESGKKTADTLISFIGTKVALTEAQKATIKGWGVTEGEAA